MFLQFAACYLIEYPYVFRCSADGCLHWTRNDWGASYRWILQKSIESLGLFDMINCDLSLSLSVCRLWIELWVSMQQSVTAQDVHQGLQHLLTEVQLRPSGDFWQRRCVPVLRQHDHARWSPQVSLDGLKPSNWNKITAMREPYPVSLLPSSLTYLQCFLCAE